MKATHSHAFYFQAVFVFTVWAAATYAAGFRLLGEGRDFINYVNFFDSIPTDLSFSDFRFEPGFVLLAWIFKNVLNTSYEQYATFIVAVSLGLKIQLFYRHCASPLLAFIVYMAIFYPLFEYTQIRAAMAAALALHAIFAFYDEKKLYSTVLFSLAISFHFSAILFPAMLFAAFLVRRNPYVILVVFLVSVIFSNAIIDQAVLAASQVNPLALAYVANAQDNIRPNIFSVLNLSLILLLAVGHFSGLVKDSQQKMFFFIGVASIAIFIIFLPVPVFASRMKELLSISFIFLVFRYRLSTGNIVPVILLTGAGFWSLYRYIGLGIIGA
ncbi:MAG: EpsG family protein [Anaerolineales bacterium]|nr:EpsG family protein [Anaerolineales bacterium]